jgi:hypothetical protein
MKVSVFRIEKPNGDGPYNDADSKVIEHMNAVHGDDEHPDPSEDPMLDGINPDESCGFATLCDLEEWFSGYEDVLADAGYGIVVYSTKREYVRWGKNQCLFLKAHAVPVRTLSVI